jgi:hypothetical protein
VNERPAETAPLPSMPFTVSKPESAASLTSKNTFSADKDTTKQTESRPPPQATLPSQHAPLLHRNDISIPPPPPEVTTRSSSLNQFVKPQQPTVNVMSQPNASVIKREAPIDTESERVKIASSNTSTVPTVAPHLTSSIPALVTPHFPLTSDSSSQPYPSQQYSYPPPPQQYQHPHHPHHPPAEDSTALSQPPPQSYHPYPPPFGPPYHPHPSPYHHDYPPSDPSYPYAPPPFPYHHPRGPSPQSSYYSYPYSAGYPPHYSPYNYLPPPSGYHHHHPHPYFPPSVPFEHSQFPPSYYPPSATSGVNGELLQNKPVIFELIQELNAAQVRISSYFYFFVLPRFSFLFL